MVWSFSVVPVLSCSGLSGLYGLVWSGLSGLVYKCLGGLISGVLQQSGLSGLVLSVWSGAVLVRLQVYWGHLGPPLR